MACNIYLFISYSKIHTAKYPIDFSFLWTIGLKIKKIGISDSVSSVTGASGMPLANTIDKRTSTDP